MFGFILMCIASSILIVANIIGIIVCWIRLRAMLLDLGKLPAFIFLIFIEAALLISLTVIVLTR